MSQQGQRTAVLLGGPTGVGKSTTLRLLPARLPRSAALDADDVWRVSAEMAVPENRQHAINNAVNGIRGYFDAGCEVGILGWVFARSELYQPVSDAFRTFADRVLQIYLVADSATIEHRLNARGDIERLDYAMSRLQLISALPFPKIDTTDLDPEEVADAVSQTIRAAVS